jgi:hypothetical protein
MFKFDSVAIALTEQLHELENRAPKINVKICAPEDADMSERALSRWKRLTGPAA